MNQLNSLGLLLYTTVLLFRVLFCFSPKAPYFIFWVKYAIREPKTEEDCTEDHFMKVVLYIFMDCIIFSVLLSLIFCLPLIMLCCSLVPLLLFFACFGVVLSFGCMNLFILFSNLFTLPV